MSTLSSLRASIASAARIARQRAAPVAQRLRSKATLGVHRWGTAGVIATGVYFLALSPETRQRFWSGVRAAAVDPLQEWRENRTHGARKQQLLAHFAVARGGETLELLPGAGGASFACLNSLADSRLVNSALPLQWRGLGIDDSNWKQGQIKEKAEMHAGIPPTLMQFDSCATRKLSLIQLLREVPDASVQNVFALHGLSPLFLASPYTHAALSSRPYSGQGPRPPTRDAELAVILREIHRVLKPGGKFFFLDLNSRNREDTIARRVQDVRHALHAPVATRTPVELAQTLPLIGFGEVHLEQWPTYNDAANPRQGVKILRPSSTPSADDSLYAPVEGLYGNSPMVSGVAIKANAQPGPIGNIFAQHSFV